MSDNLSGTIYDPELLNIYGADLLRRVDGLLQKCKNHHIKIVTAESLTGGGIANLLTCLGGSSNMLDRAYIVYNNDAKQDMLGVKAETLAEYEAVSQPVAREMALGALKNSRAQISVAVTGYAGPNGDDARGISGGTVCIASAVNGEVFMCDEFHFKGERTADRRQTMETAVEFLEKTIEQALTPKIIKPTIKIKTSAAELTKAEKQGHYHG